MLVVLVPARRSLDGRIHLLLIPRDALLSMLVVTYGALDRLLPRDFGVAGRLWMTFRNTLPSLQVSAVVCENEWKALLAASTELAEDRTALERLRAAWVAGGRALSNTNEQPVAPALGDLDDPLPDPFLKKGGALIPAPLVPHRARDAHGAGGDTLVSRFHREYHQNKSSLIPVEKARSVFRAANPKWDRALVLSGDVQLTFNKDDHVLVDVVDDYCVGLRILGNALAMAGIFLAHDLGLRGSGDEARTGVGCAVGQRGGLASREGRQVESAQARRTASQKSIVFLPFGTRGTIRVCFFFWGYFPSAGHLRATLFFFGAKSLLLSCASLRVPCYLFGMNMHV